MKDLDGEAVILNLDTGFYFGLNETGTRIWTLLESSDSVQAAYEAMLDEYDVEPGELAEEVQELIENLSENGLVVLTD